MSKEEALKKIPEKGFIKLSIDKVDFKKPQEKVALIRKGNELFNQKQYDMAKRIFITVGYTDGLIRLGDYYLEQNNPLEAFRMYWLAPAKKQVAAMTEKMAEIIKSWLSNKPDGKPGDKIADKLAAKIEAKIKATIEAKQKGIEIK